MRTRLALDHLVVAARTLDEGVRWCEATLGIVPGPGGKHARFGTHNRLAAIGTARFPRAYLEIIAGDPGAPAPGRPRWFGLDDEATHAAGPRLVHWVARVDGLDAVVAAWRAAGIDAGEILAAERDTPAGRLRWRITVRPDGRPLGGGALPTLIEWAGPHPADTMPPSGVQLESLQLAPLPPGVAGMLPDGVRCAVATAGGAALEATLATPRGPVRLGS